MATVKECRETTCRAPIVFLRNPATNKPVPVDYESLREEDVDENERVRDEVTYDPAAGHVSHFKTCKAPGRFSAGTRRP